MTQNWNIAFVLMIIGVAGLGFIAPWWSAVIWVILMVILFKLNTSQGISAGGLAIGLVWVAMARYMSQHDDAGIISKTGELMGGLSHQVMISLTFLIAVITGVLSGWFGSALTKAVFRNKNEEMNK